MDVSFRSEMMRPAIALFLQWLHFVVKDRYLLNLEEAFTGWSSEWPKRCAVSPWLCQTAELDDVAEDLAQGLEVAASSSQGPRAEVAASSSKVEPKAPAPTSVPSSKVEPKDPLGEFFHDQLLPVPRVLCKSLTKQILDPAAKRPRSSTPEFDSSSCASWCS